jgi:hypothetical protein
MARDYRNGNGMVDLDELQDMLRNRYRGTDSKLAECIQEIIHLRTALSAKEGDSVTSNDKLRGLCLEILKSDPSRMYTFNNDQLMDILGGLFKVAALSQMDPRELGGPRPIPPYNPPYPFRGNPGGSLLPYMNILDPDPGASLNESLLEKLQKLIK